MKFDILQGLGHKIPQYLRTGFLSGMIAGLITHFYMLTHKLPNWDDATNLAHYGSGNFLGRWFLKYLHPLGSRYSIPAIHGVLMILFLALAACIVLEILQLKSTTAAVLVPALMVTFPSVACTMTFMFMAHTSAMAIFMTCLAVYFLRRYRWGMIPCAVLLICSLGVYQSYISIAITLMILGMLMDVLEGKDFWKILKQGIVCVLVLLAAVGIYMWLSHLIYPNLDNETYGGVGNMGNIAISEMPVLAARCYKRFLEYFIWKPFAFVSETMQVLNIMVCVLTAGFGFYLILAKKMYRNILSCILYCVLAFFIPLAAAFVYFMAPEVDYSMLMLYAYVLIYVLLIALWEKAAAGWAGALKSTDTIRTAAAGIISIAMITVIAFSCYTNYLLSNRAYLRMSISYERVTSYFNRIIASVEAIEGYRNGEPVTILGEFYYKDNPSPVELDVLDSESLREMSGVALENGLITSGVRDDFIETFIGFNMADIDWRQKEAVMESEEYKKMPVYPANGSVQKINDIWVVKLCE